VVERYEGLLSGEARYTGDLAVDDVLHAAFVRSTVAHAQIGAIDADAAASTPGVVAVLTAADLSFVPVPPYVGRVEMAELPLARDVVRHAGERLAIVVATSRVAAEDAAELVVVDYGPLPVVTDPLAADTPGSPLVFPDHGTNVLIDLPADAPGPRLDGDVTIRLATAVPRLAVAPMEGHAVVVVPAGDRLDVWCSTQAAHLARLRLAASLGWAPERIRVRVPRVGGGFGGKAAGLPMEHVVVAATALALGRPVRYEEDRASNLVWMQGLGWHQELELHARLDGTLVGLRLAVTCDSGGYPGIAAIEPMKMKLMASGPYRIPAVEFSARAVFTNRTPTTAYRGPGRSEAAIVLERGLDVLAAELDLDPVDLRRRNLLRPDEFPYHTPTGMTYDSGDYGQLLDLLVTHADYAGLRAEQARRRATGGPLLGIGVATVVDSTAWASRSEGARVHVEADGTVVVTVATASAGQEHGVALAALVAEVLPVEPIDVVVVEGDTDLLDAGGGTSGSRSVQLAGVAVHRAASDVATAARRLTAQLLEAAEDDIVLVPGAGFGVRGVPASMVTLARLAAMTGAEAELEASCLYEQSDPTHPAAAHLSVVEVDAETGRVGVRRHVAVTDAGRIVDPPAARGQVEGAVVQGIAQALFEEMSYDAEGNPLTTSLAEYLVPSAAEVPVIEAVLVESVSPINSLGAKGIGEIGMVGAPGAVQNAVVDALSHLGVRHIDMPCTPEKVWRAINGRS
jgi:carbon-monoxide dehydrogenase large subunit